ncbi:MAG: ATP-binding protein [Candidatus Thorarchaeota archaeon]
MEKEPLLQDINDVQRLVNSMEKESTYLDYKESAALQSDKKSKTEISKDVSAFANAVGGVIICSIMESAPNLELVGIGGGSGRRLLRRRGFRI